MEASRATSSGMRASVRQYMKWSGLDGRSRAARFSILRFPNGRTPQSLQARAEVRQIAARAVAQPVEPYRGRNPRRRRVRLDSARHRACAERTADGARRASGDERRNGACRRPTCLERPRDHQAPARHRRAVAAHSLCRDGGGSAPRGHVGSLPAGRLSRFRGPGAGVALWPDQGISRGGQRRDLSSVAGRDEARA